MDNSDIKIGKNYKLIKTMIYVFARKFGLRGGAELRKLTEYREECYTLKV